MSILTNLTEGIVNRDLSKEGEAILNKWDKTGLLEGISGDFHRNQMAVLLENQAKELLRESNTMQAGDVEGFAAVAFPIVRRVFGGLLAQKLVSVQPMSLPSGLVFFMDFVKQGVKAGQGAYEALDTRDGLHLQGDSGTNPSVYGGQVEGNELLNGVNLDPEDRGSLQTPQFQDLIHGHSVARGAALPIAGTITCIANIDLDGSVPDDEAKLIDFDPDLLARDSGVAVVFEVSAAGLDDVVGADHPLVVTGATSSGFAARAAKPDMRHVVITGATSDALVAADTTCNGNTVTAPVQVRRLTKLEGGKLTFVLFGSASDIVKAETNAGATMAIEFAINDNLQASDNGLGAIVGSTAWEMEGSDALPEIAIKVDSTAITAMTRKLKASWTPELAQDLNAYHNLDAEVELTGILSEQIALFRPYRRCSGEQVILVTSSRSFRKPIDW
jgi:hypothetical protein